MTQISALELKLIYFQMIFVAVTLAFFGLYAATSQTPTNLEIETVVSSGSATGGIGGWISTLFYLPEGMDVAAEVTAVFMAPLIAFDVLIAVRYAKDILTQWV